MMKMDPRLKPCPFCGSKEIGITVDYTYDPIIVAKIKCCDCGCNIWRNSLKDTRGIYDRAVEKWNTRYDDKGGTK